MLGFTCPPPPISSTSLLKEAQPLEEKRTVEMGEERLRQHFEEEEDEESEDVDDRKLLSRYGIWLMVELCKPQQDLPIVSRIILIVGTRNLSPKNVPCFCCGSCAMCNAAASGLLESSRP